MGLLIAVLISANAEWREVRKAFPQAAEHSPYGEYFTANSGGETVLFFHGGWGKVAAAGSTQYVIDRWHPRVLLNLGTCGGFEGAIARNTIILANRTLIYDIVEQMGDASEAIRHYATDIDTNWLGSKLPLTVTKTLLISADRDLLVKELPNLRKQYGASAGDWESGAIAWVAKTNRTRVVILRGVTDLVSTKAGEAYGKPEVFQQATARVMKILIDSLPGWVELIKTNLSQPTR